MAERSSRRTESSEINEQSLKINDSKQHKPIKIIGHCDEKERTGREV